LGHDFILYDERAQRLHSSKEIVKRKPIRHERVFITTNAPFSAQSSTQLIFHDFDCRYWVIIVRGVLPGLLNPIRFIEGVNRMSIVEYEPEFIGWGFVGRSKFKHQFRA
jgi:hypothetical protein